MKQYFYIGYWPLLLIGVLILLQIQDRREENVQQRLLLRYKGVAVYDNGPDIGKSHGKHFSADGYYYGQKWQCVEFAKRFYKLVKGHEMPVVYGHAIHFYQKGLPDGNMNQARGLLQFNNGSVIPPKVDDLVVLGLSPYGHIGVIAKVNSSSIEIIQQNNGPPRLVLPLIRRKNRYFIHQDFAPKAWLRLPLEKQANRI